MRQWGNIKANKEFERNIPSHIPKPTEFDSHSLKYEYIEHKYKHLADVAENGVGGVSGVAAAAAAAIIHATPKFELLSPRKGGGDLKDCPMEKLRK